MAASPPAQKLAKAKAIASALVEESLLLHHEHALGEMLTLVETLNLESGVNLSEAVRHFEMRLIQYALDLAGNNQAQAARLLGLGTTTLNYKIKTFGMIAEIPPAVCVSE